MLANVKSYRVKPEKLLVPMAKGESSKMAFDIAITIGKVYNSEITALTIKDEKKEITWSDKVSLVLGAYKEGKKNNVTVIPKVQSARSVKHGIVQEINTKNYDIVIFSSAPRTNLSSSLLGGIGDHIIKNARTTVMAITNRKDRKGYKKIILPVCESLNTRKSVYIGLLMSNAMNAKINLVDMRKLDYKPTHGFKSLFDSMDNLKAEFPNVEMSTVERGELKETIQSRIYSTGSELMILGVRPGTTGNIRISGVVRTLIKESWIDTALIKR